MEASQGMGVAARKRGTAAKVRRLARSSAAALAWSLLGFTAGQLVLSLILYSWWPALRDPEYGQRLDALRQQITAKPGRPLVLILGSSRTAMGFRPEVLATQAVSQDPVVFNFSLLGAGPIMELLCLNRLLADGIRPDWVFVECWPLFWHQEGEYAEEKRLDVNRLSWNDAALLRPFYARPYLLDRGCWFSHLAPGFSHRFTLLSRWAPRWLDWTNRRDDGWRHLDEWGWLERKRLTGSADERHQAIERARAYFQPICDNFRFAEVSNRALRRLLRRCRDEHINVALLFMPEGKDFQNWYPPAMRAQVEAYLGQILREYGVSILDARDWMAEPDFMDGFHLLPEGAAAFTAKFGRDVLVPVLDGKLRLGSPELRRAHRAGPSIAELTVTEGRP